MRGIPNAEEPVMKKPIPLGMKTAFAVAVALLFAAPFGFAAGGGEESAYPSRTLTYVIPFNPGGQSDITAQYQKEDLQRALGVNVIIKHMPGAGGAVAWSSLAKMKPDGYTISGNNIPHIIIQPLVRDDAGYQTGDLVPVYMFQTTPIGLAVLKDSEFDTLDELIEYAKANPGKVTVGGSGTHSGHHLALLQLQKLAGVEFTYIPSTGAAPSVANFLGGHTAALFANSNDLVQHQDKIKVLGMGTEKRFEALVGVPTFREQGVKMTAGIDRGVCVPPGTPGEVIETLEDAFDVVCSSEAFVNKMVELGFVVHNLKGRRFAKYIQEKTEEYRTILEENTGPYSKSSARSEAGSSPYESVLRNGSDQPSPAAQPATGRAWSRIRYRCGRPAGPHRHHGHCASGAVHLYDEPGTWSASDGGHLLRRHLRRKLLGHPHQYAWHAVGNRYDFRRASDGAPRRILQGHRLGHSRIGSGRAGRRCVSSFSLAAPVAAFAEVWSTGVLLAHRFWAHDNRHPCVEVDPEGAHRGRFWTAHQHDRHRTH
jgi:tripartite-type tricarboxylate transporter receptor subunit TctC